MDQQQTEITEITDDLVTSLELPPHTHVVTWNNSAWPAWTRDGFVVVDLRLHDPADCSDHPELTFRPEALARAGVPDAVILDAAATEPPGFCTLEL